MERVCTGRFGEVDGNQGIEMTCPDGTEWQFHGDKETAQAEARRVLVHKGYDAKIVDDS
jgi:hypothetical protein